jgi:hypothetical protein
MQCLHSYHVLLQIAGQGPRWLGGQGVLRLQGRGHHGGETAESTYFDHMFPPGSSTRTPGPAGGTTGRSPRAAPWAGGTLGEWWRNPSQCSTHRSTSLQCMTQCRGQGTRPLPLPLPLASYARIPGNRQDAVRAAQYYTVQCMTQYGAAMCDAVAPPGAATPRWRTSRGRTPGWRSRRAGMRPPARQVQQCLQLVAA